MAGDSGDKRGRSKKREQIEKKDAKQLQQISKYSVLMSVYKKEEPAFLKAAISSMMEQTVLPDQFVLVCDGPLTEALDEVVEHFQEQHPEVFLVVRLKECGGLGPALQIGIKHCRNELIARMDSDDISRCDRCEKQLFIFHKKQVDMVGGIIEEFASDVHEISGKRVTPRTNEAILKCAGRRNPFNHVTMMYRKSAVTGAGGYQDFPYFEDYYLWARMLKNGAVGYNIQEPLVYVRTGESMFARRGGMAYAKLAVKFRWYLKKNGLSTWFDFVVSAGGQVLICIMPNGFRKKFYEVILRKTK